MKRIFIFIAIIIFVNTNLISQCPGNGQNPSSALPACGTAVFNQTTVPTCTPGRQVAMPGNICGGGSGLTDINPYYYKFTCYISGPLEFNIKPNASDDYDWQLFDITNKNPNDIYTDASTFVACNWSGNTGTTGTSTTATTVNGCEGTGVPLITKAPTLIAGHLYLLMVSHFTPGGQSGYNLTFSAASANLVTDPNVPKVDTVTAACGGQEVSIKLNKKVRCSSIASDGSDFVFQSNPTVASCVGIGCNTGFDTDSIIVNLATPMVSGIYNFNITAGTDGNTILDFCDNAMVAGNNQKNLYLFKKPSAGFTFSVINETCKADTFLYKHDGNNGVNKWEWTFDGTPTSSTLQNQQVVYNSFSTRVVKLKVSNPSCSDSITQNIPIADHTLVPKIIATRDTTCPNNPETFSDASTGNIVSRFWDFDNGQTSTSPNPPAQTYPVLANNKIYDTKLVITNAMGCKDSIIKNIFVRGTIPTVFDSIIPPTCAAAEVKIFFKQDMICGSIALDGSDFTINGVATNSIISASIACANGVGTIVTLQLATPLKTGTYNLTLKKGSDGNTIINDCGIETLVATVSFQSFEHINPVFNYNSRWGCKQDTIVFNHPTNNLVNKWQWSFTDGSPDIATSNTQTATVIYNNVTANHNVQLIVSNGVCTDTSNQSVTIIDHSIQAKYGNPDTTCGLANTIFTDSSKGIIATWNWSFGAGLTSNLKSPLPVNYPLQYVYATYATQLVVKNSVGCFDTSAIKNIVVKPSSPALMDKMDYNICAPDSFILYFNSPMLCNTVATDGSDFTITGASNPTISSAYIVNCSNGFGKAIVVKLTTPITVGGYYNLNLVKGSDGNTILNDCGVSTAPAFIGFIAHNNVDATFTSSIKTNCTADTLLLNHTVANEENKWTWIVNGISIGVLPTLTIPYRDSSVKNIALIVANPSCKDTSSQSFSLVFDKVEAKFVVDRNVICPTEAVKFTDISSGKVVKWKWDFGNGLIDNTPNPLLQNFALPTDRTNPTTGNPMLTGDNYYTTRATLIVGNAVPCYDTIYQTLKITSNCLIQVPTAFTPNGDGLNDFLYPLNTYKANKFNFRVYNRAGALIFESSTEGSKWNGNNYLRTKQPAGTYVWTLIYTDKETGKEIFLKGTTVLIR